MTRQGAVRRGVALVSTVAVLAAGCGGDDEAAPTPEPTPSATATPAPDPSPTDVPEPTSEPTTEPTSEPTAEPTSEPTAEPGDGGVVNADPVVVDLADFMITTATTVYAAGTINFEVVNDSDIAHEFGVARGESYDTLPKLDNGSIDEEALGDDFLGKTPVVDPVLGPVREISFTLEPGQYVFFCNLVVGPVSHAARGQHLPVTVVE